MCYFEYSNPLGLGFLKNTDTTVRVFFRNEVLNIVKNIRGVIDIEFHDDYVELPIKCQDCIWRRGKVCSLPKCVKDVQNTLFFDYMKRYSNDK